MNLGLCIIYTLVMFMHMKILLVCHTVTSQKSTYRKNLVIDAIQFILGKIGFELYQSAVLHFIEAGCFTISMHIVIFLLTFI